MDEGEITSLTEYIENNVLPVAIQAGIDITQFYDLTLGEIYLIIDQYKEKVKMQQLFNAQNQYYTAMFTVTFLGASLKGMRVPDIEEMFPDLFDQEAYENKKLEELQQQLIDFGNKRNAMLKKEKKKHG